MDVQKQSRSVRSRAIEFMVWSIGAFLVAAVLGTASPLGAYGAGVVAAVIAVAVLFGLITLPVLGKTRAVGLIWLSFVLVAGTAGYQVQLAEDKRLVAELAELRSTDVDAYLQRIRDDEELWLTELEALRPEAYEEEVARRERDAAEAEAVRIAEIERRREEREAEREAIRAQAAEQAALQAQVRFEAALARAVAEVDGPLILPTSMEDIGGFLARIDRQAEPFVLVAEAAPTSDQLEQLRALRTEVTAFQEREFPRVRDALGPLLRRALWIDDTTARTTGPGFRTLELTSYRYTLNRNIQADFDPVRETLIQLRFSNVVFHEFEDGPGSQFTLDHASPADEEILIWRGGLPRRAVSYVSETEILEKPAPATRSSALPLRGTCIIGAWQVDCGVPCVFRIEVLDGGEVQSIWEFEDGSSTSRPLSSPEYVSSTFRFHFTDEVGLSEQEIALLSQSGVLTIRDRLGVTMRGDPIGELDLSLIEPTSSE